MNLSDIVYGPWAITPEMHAEILEIYARHLRGEQADFAKIEAALGRDMDNERKPYRVVKRVAVLPIIGVVAKRANMFMRISGGVSTELLGRDFAAALDDPEVDAVLFETDTPGGAVDGTPEFAEQIYQARGRKPIITWSSGIIHSAGIWFGVAADKVLISSNVVTTGSIGVVAHHRDVSELEKSRGIKTTEITAGKFKRITSSYAPLSKDGKDDIQGMIDHIYSFFISSIARYRGVEEKKVLHNMADGRVFIGQQGIDAGLVDSIATFDEALEQARSMAGKFNSRHGRANGESMDLKSFMADHPVLHASIIADAKASAMKEITGDRIKDILPDVSAGLIAKGAAAERARIAEVREQSMPGHEGLIAKMELDGVSTGADAAKAIVASEKSMRIKAQDNLSAGNEVIDTAPVEEEGGKKMMKRTAFDELTSSAKTTFLAEDGIIKD